MAPLHVIALGEVALQLALALSSCAIALLVAGVVLRRTQAPLPGEPQPQIAVTLMSTGRRLFYLVAVALTVSISALLYGFLSEGAYDVEFVFSQSSPATSLGLKVAGVWAGQNGSILFWTWMLALYGAALAFALRRNPTAKVPWVLLVFAVVQVYFTGSVLLLDQNPFVLLERHIILEGLTALGPQGLATGSQVEAWLATSIHAAEGLTYGDFLPAEIRAQIDALGDRPLPEGLEVSVLAAMILDNAHAAGHSVIGWGQGINPLLANYWILIHPPAMYAGYIGTAIVFSYSLGALIVGETDRWVREVRPWLLWTWFFLTIGNILGGLWAYEELGWGGFWDWDPVENGAILPWFVATALLHSVMVQERRGSLRVWNVALAAGLFITTILGTWIVRSGMINSIHAFAMNTEIGFALLVLVGLSTIAVTWGIAVRWNTLRHAPRELETPSGLVQHRPKRSLDRLASTEFAILGGNIALTLMTLLVLSLTLAPLISWRFTGERVDTHPLYFITAPFFIVTFFFMALGMAYSWRKLNEKQEGIRLWWPLAIGIVVAALSGLFQFLFTQLNFGTARTLFELGGGSTSEWLHALMAPIMPPLVFGVAAFGFAALMLEYHLPAWAASRGRKLAEKNKASTAAEAEVKKKEAPSYAPVEPEENEPAAEAPSTASQEHRSYLGAMFRLIRADRRRYGGFLVHFGALMLFVGICVALEFKTEEQIDNVPLGSAVSFEAGFPTKDTFTYTFRRLEVGATLDTSNEIVAERMRGDHDSAAREMPMVVRDSSAISGDANLAQITPHGELPIAIYEAPGSMGLHGQMPVPFMDQNIRSYFLDTYADPDIARTYMFGNWRKLLELDQDHSLPNILPYTYTRSWLELRIGQPAIELDLSGLFVPASGGDTTRKANLLLMTELGPLFIELEGMESGEGRVPAFRRIVRQLTNLVIRLERPALAEVQDKLGTDRLTLGIAVIADEQTFRVRLLPTGAVRSLSPRARSGVRAQLEEVAQPQLPAGMEPLPSRQDAPWGFLEVRVLEGPVQQFGEPRVLVKEPNAVLHPEIRQYQFGDGQVSRRSHFLRRLPADEMVVPTTFFHPFGEVEGAPSVGGFVFHHNPAILWNLIGTAMIVLGTLVAFWPQRRRRRR